MEMPIKNSPIAQSICETGYTMDDAARITPSLQSSDDVAATEVQEKTTSSALLISTDVTTDLSWEQEVVETKLADDE